MPRVNMKEQAELKGKYGLSLEDNVIPARLAKLRTDKGWKQQEFADILREKTGDDVYTIPVISMWETGRRVVSPKHYDVLSEMLECSVLYLCGKTNERNGKKIKDETNGDDSDKSRLPISITDLDNYDGLPVYVEFINSDHIDGWGVFSKKIHGINMIGFVLSQKSLSSANIRLSVYNNLLPDVILDTQAMMPPAAVVEADKVWVELISNDPLAHECFDGWYSVADNRDYLVSCKGQVLPVSGINIGFKCFSAKGNGKYF